MNEFEAARAKAAMAYNAAADYFDHPVSSFWHRFGLLTIDRLGLAPGEIVLDVCSGSGGSALPAAERVGSQGWVTAVDIAERLIALARAKAEAKGLSNIAFRADDMLALGYPDASFDAVVCVFGIFFVPDMAAAIRELWRMVRPGGRLAITTWGPNLFEPASGVFWDLIRQERPDLYQGFRPWERISEPSGLRALLAEAGVNDVEIVAEPGAHPLKSPGDWWAVVMGSGYRGTLAQLDEAAFARVRDGSFRRLQESGVTAIETNVVYAIARKNGGDAE